MNYKTFDDLEFGPWGALREGSRPIPPTFIGSEQAVMTFPNGYGVSVLCGDCFYSDGLTSYEVAVLNRNNQLCYPPSVCPDNDVLGYQSEREVTEIMKKVQDLPEETKDNVEQLSTDNCREGA